MMSTDKQLSKQDAARVTKAVQEGQKVVKAGGTKVDASMAIIRMINDLDQETVVIAFVDGATLTPKGALNAVKLRRECEAMV